MIHCGETIELNNAQRDAVDHDGGPLLVLAGPGTGKTRVIIARLLRMLREGRDPKSLLAVTFSVKATNEMRERLASWAGEELASAATDVRVSTFHSLGRGITQRFGDVLGVRPELKLLDAAVSKRLLRGMIGDMGLFRSLAKEGYEKVIGEHLAFEAACKHNAKSGADAVAHATAWAKRLDSGEHGLTGDALKAEQISQSVFADHARLYEAFDRACLARGLITFDDYLAYPLRIFKKEPDLASFLRAEYRHVVVDELQDVNPAQLELMRWICPPSANVDLCAVGDDDQAIYAFRGSDPAAITAFKATWASHRTVALTDNHRSAPNIVGVGNALIARASARVAPDKRIIAKGKHAHPGLVEAYTVPTDNDHGTLVAALILADRAKNPGRAWSDYAVLCRGKAQIEKCAVALGLKGIPVDTRRRATPLDDAGVQDLLAWAAVLCTGDDAGVQRLLVRPSLGVPIETVRGWREAHAAARRAYTNEAGDGAPAFTGFADWLVSHHAEVPEVARFAALLAELRRAGATMPADEAIERIIIAAHLIGDDGPEPLDAHQRAERARMLVSVVRFARARQAFLDHPADLAAFLSYYNDLDDEGKNFRSAGSDEVDGVAEEERPDAVSVITAHRAKGLEWDTVFVVKVAPGEGGFGMGKREEPGHHDLPGEFTGRPGVGDPDEELRLCYVACTRAKRRLILTAKAKKPPKASETSTNDLFVHLTHFSPGLGLPVVTMEEVLRSVGVETPSELETELAARGAARGGASREELIRRESVFVRQSAFAALHDAASPGADVGAMRAVEDRLIDAAHALAALTRLSGVPKADQTGDDGAGGGGVLVRRVRDLASRLGAPSDIHPWPAPPAPFMLSFTQIKAYQECPRCWYLRYVLGLPARGSTQANLGTVAHAALQEFYRRFRDSEDSGTPPTAADLHRMADGAFDRIIPAMHPESAGERARLHAQLDAMLERLHPTTFQVVELEFPVTMPFVDSRGNTHALFAKIDRLDLTPEGTHRVIDYKTGYGAKSLLQPSASDLQLGIYAMALAHHVGGGEMPPGVAEYWVLSKGESGVIALGDLKIDKVKAVIDKAVIGMLTPPYERSEECQGHCELMG